MNLASDGKRAAVTAGAGGAGLVIARTLSDAGTEAFVCDIDADAVAPLGVDGHPETLYPRRFD